MIQSDEFTTFRLFVFQFSPYIHTHTHTHTHTHIYIYIYIYMVKYIQPEKRKESSDLYINAYKTENHSNHNELKSRCVPHSHGLVPHMFSDEITKLVTYMHVKA